MVSLLTVAGVLAVAVAADDAFALSKQVAVPQDIAADGLDACFQGDGQYEYKACAGQTLTSGACYGAETCEDSTFASYYMYCYGYKSCEGAALQSHANMRCGGMYGCSSADMTVTGKTGWVICDGYVGCIDGTTNAYGTMCLGEHACRRATLNSQRVLCKGFYGCDTVQIGPQSGYSTLQVEADGPTGFLNAVITCPAGIACTLELGGDASDYTDGSQVVCESGATLTANSASLACPGTYSLAQAVAASSSTWALAAATVHEATGVPHEAVYLAAGSAVTLVVACVLRLRRGSDKHECTPLLPVGRYQGA